MTIDNQSSELTAPLVVLHRLTGRAQNLLNLPHVNRGAAALWIHTIRNQLERIYGKGAPEALEFPLIPGDISEDHIREMLMVRLNHLHRMIDAFKRVPGSVAVSPLRNRVFIGHGRSPAWRELKDFLADRLFLPWDEFNREAVAGLTTAERLQSMMSHAVFAILVLTAEEERVDSTLHARANVIHEVGLFQGCLGLRRAVVLIEEGCSEFSNISGLSHIRFPRNDISARFEEIRRVLERENLI